MFVLDAAAAPRRRRWWHAMRAMRQSLDSSRQSVASRLRCAPFAAASGQHRQPKRWPRRARWAAQCLAAVFPGRWRVIADDTAQCRRVGTLPGIKTLSGTSMFRPIDSASGFTAVRVLRAMAVGRGDATAALGFTSAQKGWADRAQVASALQRSAVGGAWSWEHLTVPAMPASTC
ncbi:MAG: hypothetical protein MUC86_05020 [Burkholderiaceae bacterium]|nr:hypothetical protein [Burkholderiaceae bacterium]